MVGILNSGRYIFPLSFLLYVGLHLGKPDVGASFVPDLIPFPYLELFYLILYLTIYS